MESKFNYKKFRKSQIIELLGTEHCCDNTLIIDILLDKIIEQQDYISVLRQSLSKLAREFEALQSYNDYMLHDYPF